MFALVVLFVHSPFVRVQTVVWTGHVTLEEARYKSLESVTLGRSLWLLSEKRLALLLAADPDVLALRFRRHPPHTLEVCIEPRDAVARLASGEVVDPEGRLVSGVPFEDLPLLHGVATDAAHRRVDGATTVLLQALHAHLPTAAVRLAQIEGIAGGWMLTLAESGTRVRVGEHDVADQIEKLRVYEQSLAQGEMPDAIDLRWRGQIVLQNEARRGAGDQG